MKKLYFLLNLPTKTKIVKQISTMLMVAACCFIYTPPSYSQAANVDDSLELVNLYNTTNGPNWVNKTGWLNGPVRNWFGVSLNNSGRVINISLANNQLTGSVPNFNLPSLQVVFLVGNQLTGDIPDFHLPLLQNLWLSNNQLTGSIPNFNLPALQILLLTDNQLSGSIPNFNLPALQYLQLYNNQLTGNIPNFNLPSLITLHLRFNQLTGSIPNFNLPALQGLQLEGNQLSGNIPNFNLPALQVLNLGINQLSGDIPNFNLPALQYLSLNNNQLSGNIPNFNLPALLELKLGFNRLTGTIPNFNLPSLTSFDIAGNKFTFESLEEFIQNHPLPFNFSFHSQHPIAIRSTNCKLSVSAGGTLTNNTYRWFRHAQLVSTNVGDSTFIPTEAGVYTVTVNNSIAVGLTLNSLQILISKPELGPPKIQEFCPLTFADISHFFDDILNANPNYSVVGWSTLITDFPIDPTIVTYGNTYKLVVEWNSTGCKDTGIVYTAISPDATDEMVTIYIDSDLDGYGDASTSIQACVLPSGYVTNNIDCDDNNSSVHPNTTEVCSNNIDDNCNGQIDEECLGPPSITINDINVYESLGSATITVSLSYAKNENVTVRYRTVDGTAVSNGPPSLRDFTKKSGRLIFPPGTITQNIIISINVDNLIEGNEYFDVELTGAVNAAITDDIGRVTIEDGSPTTVAKSSPINELAENEFLSIKAFPNPFSKTTTIEYRIPNDGKVKLSIYDLQGREVAILVNETKSAGVYKINFAANKLAAGTYICRMNAGDFTEIKKLVLIR